MGFSVEFTYSVCVLNLAEIFRKFRTASMGLGKIRFVEYYGVDTSENATFH